MRIIHGRGFSEEERKAFAKCIFQNIFTAMKAMTGAMTSLKIPYSNPENEVAHTHPSAGKRHTSAHAPVSKHTCAGVGLPRQQHHPDRETAPQPMTRLSPLPDLRQVGAGHKHGAGHPAGARLRRRHPAPVVGYGHPDLLQPPLRVPAPGLHGVVSMLGWTDPLLLPSFISGINTGLL